MSQLYISSHPLVRASLASLRDRQTKPAEFRRLVRVLSYLLAYEATVDLTTRDVEVETPMGTAKCGVLTDRVGIVPILRAGLGMVDGVLDLVPDAQVWHVGMFRDEATLLPTEYYNKLPNPAPITLALVIDPMLATGGSAVRACRVALDAGVERVKFVALIAAPEGIERLASAHPHVSIHVGAVDDRLNEVGFILPGLGDAGDRQFGT